MKKSIDNTKNELDMGDDSDQNNKADYEKRILQELKTVDDKVWYTRHVNRMHRLANGDIEIIEPNASPSNPSQKETIVRSILEQAIKSAKTVERKYGKKNLGPWTEFEWGEIVGQRAVLNKILDGDITYED